jgi:hypothetical protein
VKGLYQTKSTGVKIITHFRVPRDETELFLKTLILLADVFVTCLQNSLFNGNQSDMKTEKSLKRLAK